jgi:hypothetical protein
MQPVQVVWGSLLLENNLLVLQNKTITFLLNSNFKYCQSFNNGKAWTITNLSGVLPYVICNFQNTVYCGYAHGGDITFYERVDNSWTSRVTISGIGSNSYIIDLECNSSGDILAIVYSTLSLAFSLYRCVPSTGEVFLLETLSTYNRHIRVGQDDTVYISELQMGTGFGYRTYANNVLSDLIPVCTTGDVYVSLVNGKVADCGLDMGIQDTTPHFIYQRNIGGGALNTCYIYAGGEEEIIDTSVGTTNVGMNITISDKIYLVWSNYLGSSHYHTKYRSTDSEISGVVPGDYSLSPISPRQLSKGFCFLYLDSTDGNNYQMFYATDGFLKKSCALPSIKVL